MADTSPLSLRLQMEPGQGQQIQYSVPPCSQSLPGNPWEAHISTLDIAWQVCSGLPPSGSVCWIGSRR